MMHSWLMEQSVSCSTVPAPLAPFPRYVWKLVGAAIHRHGLIYSSLLTDILLSLLKYQAATEKCWCFLTVAMTMTNGGLLHHHLLNLSWFPYAATNGLYH